MREQLHALVNDRPDELLQDAVYALTHLEDDEPLSPEELANLEAAQQDITHRRMIALEEYEKQRNLS